MSSIVDALNAKFGVNGENIADSISKITRGEGGGSTPTPTPTPTPSEDSLLFPVMLVWDESGATFSVNKTVFEIKNAIDSGKIPLGIFNTGVSLSIGSLSNISTDDFDNPVYCFQYMGGYGVPDGSAGNGGTIFGSEVMVTTEGVNVIDIGGDLFNSGCIANPYNQLAHYYPGDVIMMNGDLYQCIMETQGEYDDLSWSYLQGGIMSIVRDLMPNNGSGGDA